ncbi:hypothetical protein BDC45DRAFT_506682 [Circinella umbellata]|nr:hypothetical protein BDC45DRAFT_506682 [Circinella umbellata]
MITAFTIDLDESYLILSDKPAIISGLLRARSTQNLSCINGQLNLVGYGHVGSGEELKISKEIEKVTINNENTNDKSSDDNDNNTIIVLKDRQTINKWYYLEQEECYTAPFMFQIPGNLPPTLSIHNEAVIKYSMTASLPSYGIQTTRVIEVFRSCDSDHQQHPKTRIYWGTTNSKRWRYEVEIPTIIPILQRQKEQEQRFTLSVRARSSFKSVNQSESESCLIACQLLETVETKHHPKGRVEPCMISTQILMSPAQSWTKPCHLPITFTSEVQQPHPTVIMEMIKIRHRFCVTLAFSSAQGHDDKLQFDFPVELVHTLKPFSMAPTSVITATATAPTTRTDFSKITCHQLSSQPFSSSTLCYYTDSSSDDCESRDSGVFLSS